MGQTSKAVVARLRRHKRIRRRIFGTPSRPRLCVFRSNLHIYAQIVDDMEGHVLVSASTLDPTLRKEIDRGGNIQAARKMGALIAERALAKGIKEVIFDRGGYLYHGRVKALAEAAREAGLKF
ncbi:MAG: 50S ribosomal protein L18 [Actinomycetota bacterium]|nr:50S ribosomal protein L18 [Actinomycetota bacterium]